MNWLFGFFVLFLSRALMIKTFKEQKKVFFVFKLIVFLTK